MTFVQSEIGFEPGIFANRSRRASKRRWVDGNLVRFRDGVPAQMGGWRTLLYAGTPIDGKARSIIAWRPNDQSGRYAAIGTHTGAFVFDGGSVYSITPDSFAVGRVDSVIGSGYGVSLHGVGAYGVARPTSGQLLSASTWSFDMFGEILLGCFSSDGIIRRYRIGTDAKLVPISGAPKARAICVSAERHVFAFGCDDNPRLVKWSDRESTVAWTPSSTNRAGGYEMQSSSPFQCGIRARGQIVAFTQTETFLFYPLGNSLVYGRETLAESIGIAGPSAACVMTDQSAETLYWMNVDGFYAFDGIVRRLSCDLQDYVFDDINLLQRAKFHASTNIEFSEVRFSYCSAGSAEIDRCVVFCVENGTWTKANISRLVWLDRRIFNKPIAVDGAGTIFEHEVGETADGATMGSFVQSHPLTVGVGQQFADLLDFWPDLNPASAGAALTIFARDYPNAPQQTFGPYTLSPTMEKVDLNISVRQLELRISGTGGYWELGVPLMSMQGGGLR